jgi:periplasmic copper chaperone A
LPVDRAQSNLRFMNRRAFVQFAGLLGAGSNANAHSVIHADLLIGHSWALPSNLNEGQVFMPILNKAAKVDKLIAARTDFAATVELRRNNRYSDPAEEAFVLPPNKPFAMRPTAFHLRLVGLQRPLRLGDRFNMVLDFENAGEAGVEVYVEASPGD